MSSWTSRHGRRYPGSRPPPGPRQAGTGPRTTHRALALLEGGGQVSPSLLPEKPRPRRGESLLWYPPSPPRAQLASRGFCGSPATPPLEAPGSAGTTLLAQPAGSILESRELPRGPARSHRWAPHWECSLGAGALGGGPPPSSPRPLLRVWAGRSSAPPAASSHARSQPAPPPAGVLGPDSKAPATDVPVRASVSPLTQRGGWTPVIL